MCSINAVGAQGRGCSSLLCQAHVKMGVLLHKQATVRFDLILAVFKSLRFRAFKQGRYDSYLFAHSLIGYRDI